MSQEMKLSFRTCHPEHADTYSHINIFFRTKKDLWSAFFNDKENTVENISIFWIRKVISTEYIIFHVNYRI